MRLAKVLFIVSFLSVPLFGGITGKIAGEVKDSKTGENLIGVSILIEGTTLGASTNVDGYYVIVNVPSGTYRVKASYVGYRAVMMEDVRVFIDQTTTLNFSLQQSVVEAKEVVIVAQRPVVQRDIAASRANITAEEVAALPISQVSGVIGLQAGVQGLSVRGGGSDQTAFVIDGLTMRNARDNTPYTAISLLAVQDIQVQTGGFSAEYGNVRSGNINVITKEGSPVHYNVGAIVRYSPPSRKYFGIAPNDFDSYWVRPFLDDAVAWTGTTNGAWDPYTQRQYESFAGWNAIAQKTLSDPNPANHLSPEAAQEIFKWQHRKNFNITKPDYTADFSLGGPVPVVSEMLGNLRFYAFYRSTQTEYSLPLSRDGVNDYSADVKLTSDVGEGMKLMLEGLVGTNQAVDANQTGVYGSYATPEGIANAMDRVSYIDARLFSTDYWAPNNLKRSSIGAKFTHVLTPKTFYEVSAQRFEEDYSTNPSNNGINPLTGQVIWSRDTSRIYGFGNGYYVDQAPFGFFPNPLGYSLNGIDGSMRMAVGFSDARDTSSLIRYDIKGDFTSQLDKYNEVKSGLEFEYIDNRVNYGSLDIVLPVGRTTSKWTTHPIRFEAYVKDKLEFEGMIVDVGVRYSMSYAGGDWYVYNPFTKLFYGKQSLGIDTSSQIEKQPTAKVSSWSPRLGIAFPITENAKLFFNYGHFRSLPTPENLYMIRRESSSQSITRIANPNLPLPKTVSYELGYEHNLFDLFLLRLTGYYKDVSDESYLVNYVGYGSTPNYTVSTPNFYEDMRGFELSLTKNRGDWVQGFLNYTYMVTTSGHFGWGFQYQNFVDQTNYQLTNPVITRPLPKPYARANVNLFTPVEFGPSMGDFYPLGNWRLNFLGSWSSGFYFTWTGGGAFPGVANNAHWADQWGADIRLSKGIKFAGVNIELFMDVNNIFNLKQMATYQDAPVGFVDGSDYLNYMKSLHLPSSFDQFGYGNIDGNDQPGDYRKSSYFQPMEYTENLSSVGSPSTVAFYYEKASNAYYQWVNNSWQPADKAKVDKALSDKAYIDMPNQPWLTFLNPRDIFFGIRLSLDVF